MVTIAIIAAVTTLLCTLIVCAAISGRAATPCLFNQADVLTRESRITGGKCSGKADNVYMSWGGPTKMLHDARACNAHTGALLDLADILSRESAPLV